MRALFGIAIELRQNLGCVGVVVDAKPEAQRYYSHYGFVELDVIEGMLEERPAPKPMFLPLSVIVQAARGARQRKPD